jgi:branched-chain amino acid transport system ATP-binding protein
LAADATLLIQNLRAGYGELDIISHVNMLVKPGEFVALMGPNGAGKSTLLKTLFGLTTIKEGSVKWSGAEITGRKPKQILAAGIAYVPQGRCNFPQMSVEENLRMAAFTIRDSRTGDERAEVYDMFPKLKERRATLAGNMSGGEQQLLEMAMALLQRPRLLLVDEPSVGLSPQAIGIVFEQLARIHASGRTILLVEQNTKKAMQAAERAIVLRLGEVIWDGPVAEINHEQLGDLFMTGRLADGHTLSRSASVPH